MTRAERQKLIKLVEKIRDVAAYSERRMITFVDKFKAAIPHPAGSDLLYYPGDWGLSELATAEEVLDFAFAWQPVFIVAQIKHMHANRPYFVYRIIAPGKLASSVVSLEQYNVGDHVLVATSGTCYHGEIVTHRLVKVPYSEYEMFTIGELISKTDLPVGTIVESME